MPWNGLKRRMTDFIEPMSDHDKMIRMIEIQANTVKELEEHKNDYKEHKTEDNANFKRIDKTISVATGVVVAVVFIVRIIWK